MFDEKMPVALGLDVGGTKIAAGLVSLEGQLFSQIWSETVSGKTGQFSPFEQLSQIIDDVFNQSNIEAQDVMGIGLALPGYIRESNGTLITAVNLSTDWIGVRFGHELTEQLGIPVFSINDNQAGALAEQYFGAGKGLTNFAYLAVGTGISAGLVLNGKLYRGTRCRAGNVGHNTVVRDGAVCSCGNSGCLETVAAGWAIVDKVCKLIQAGTATIVSEWTNGDAEQVNGEYIFKAAKAGDPPIVEIVEQMAYYLAVCCINLLNTVDLEKIIIGGGFGLGGGDYLLERIRHYVSLYHVGASYSDDVPPLEIMMSTLGETANFIGAAGLVFSKMGVL